MSTLQKSLESHRKNSRAQFHHDLGTKSLVPGIHFRPIDFKFTGEEKKRDINSPRFFRVLDISRVHSLPQQFDQFH